MFGKVIPTLVVPESLRTVLCSLLESRAHFNTNRQDAAKHTLLNDSELSVWAASLEWPRITNDSENAHS